MTDIEVIKSKLDIVDVVSGYIEVKRAGVNFKARCPFHNEKTPSFTVNPSLQIYKCFGCGKGGDAISFIQEMERVDFPEAIKIAAQKAGVELTGAKPNPQLAKEKEKIIEAHTLAAKYFHFIFKTHETGEKARKYAEKRQINNYAAEKFLIGYAPNSNDNLKKFLLAKGFNEGELTKWGLLVERNGKFIDKFRNRLMHPIFNIKGDVVAFSGRYIGTSKYDPKYLNSPETLVYKKNEILYGLFQAIKAAKEKKFMIIVEGNVDILSSHRVGVENICAPLGTSFTKEQAKLLKRYVDEVYFSFDTDSAGINAIVRGLAIAEEAGLKHRVIDVSGFQDADELICKAKDEWQKRIDTNINTIEFLIKKYSASLDLGNPDDKSKFYSLIIPILKSIKDEVQLNHFAREVAVMIDIPFEHVLEKQKMDIQRPKVNIPANVNSKVTHDILEVYFLSLLLQNQDPKVVKMVEDVFIDTDCKIIFLKLQNNLDFDTDKMIEGLTDIQIELLGNMWMIDLSKVKDMKVEIDKVYKRLRLLFLKSEIRKIKTMLLKDPDSKQLVNLLQKLSDRLVEANK